MSGDPRTIAIVGAGFSGTAVAANLLNQPHGQRLRIVLLDRSGIGRGAAYADRDYSYLLNVPAGRMSASSNAPLDFLHFARHRFPHATAQDFLPRALYGEYLEWKLLSAELSAPPHIESTRVHGEVHAIRHGESASAFELQLADGRTIAADEVVLAPGNPPPAELPGTAALIGTDRYIADPWRTPIVARAGEAVLVLGTGLTMADVVLAMAATSNGTILIHALSRHGWLPAPQNIHPAADNVTDADMLLEASAISMRQLLRAVRVLVERVQVCSGDWRDVINCVRRHAPTIWQRLALNERRRFLRHVRALWEIHRHRLPQTTFANLNQLRATRQLQIHAGRLLRCEVVDKRVRVSWRPRASAELSYLTVDRIINCTGANHNVDRLQSPLWRSLLSAGIVSPDPLGLGLRTGAHGAVINAQGQIVDHLYYIGPMLQAAYWESTAVLELRGHAERLASRLTTPRWRAETVGRPEPSSSQWRAVAPLLPL